MKYKDTKLIVFLKTFSNEELSEFEKFLASPYFKTSRNLLPLLTTLRRFHPDFSQEKFTEENIFKELYPDADFSDKKSKDILRTLTSSLLKSAEEFLFISNIRNNKILKNRTVLKEFLDRNLTKYYEQYLPSAYDELKNDEDIFGKDFLEKFYLERLSTKYSSLILDFNKLFKHSFSALDLISSYFLLDLIRTAKTLYLGELSRGLKKENISEKLLEAIDVEKILNIYEGTTQYPYIYFNYYTYLCMKNDLNEEYYEKAKNIFFENRAVINRYDKNFFYADLINVNMLKSSCGNYVNPDVSLFLIKSCLEDKAYKVSDDDFMQVDFYRNALLVASSANEFEWASEFINKYTDELKPEIRYNMEHYSKALMQYENGKFEASLESISKMKYDLAHFKLDIKILMLKIFYDLKLYEQAYSMIDTFRHYIKASTVMREKIKESYNNFLKYYQKILKLQSSENADEAGLIKEQMEEEKIISYKSWLVEKIKEFEIISR